MSMTAFANASVPAYDIIKAWILYEAASLAALVIFDPLSAAGCRLGRLPS